jgi:hypothetical protein
MTDITSKAARDLRYGDALADGRTVNCTHLRRDGALQVCWAEPSSIASSVLDANQIVVVRTTAEETDPVAAEAIRLPTFVPHWARSSETHGVFEPTTPAPDYTVTDDGGVVDRDGRPVYLPHPGVSDEFWEKVPEGDRETFSAYLVAQATDAAEVNPESYPATLAEDDENLGLLDLPEVTVRRGGITFTHSAGLIGPAGWLAPSEAIYGFSVSSKPLTKKQLRARVKSLEEGNASLRKTLTKERRRSRKKDARIARLLRIIERLG